MPRRPIKTEPSSASRSSSKRPAAETPSRQSKRARATTRKSYVDPGTDTDNSDEEKVSSSGQTADDAGNSDFEAHQEDGVSSESEGDAYASEEEVDAKKSTTRGRPSKKMANEKVLWKPGAKLAPGTQIIIKKPKARDAGDIPYSDGTIHPNSK